jgi:uncharacterized integral membrane protein
MSKNKNTITQTKAYFDINKELDYINSMNKEGWKLVYIKSGMFYTFEKAEPDEYVTLLHCDKKENISKIQTFAAQCGYESIPHTFDGLGDTLYLTGKKSVVSDDFVTDIDSQIKHFERLNKKFFTFEMLYIILAIILSLETVWIVSMDYFMGWEIVPMDIVFGVLAVIGIFLAVRVAIIKKGIKNKIKSLKNEEQIFE